MFTLAKDEAPICLPSDQKNNTANERMKHSVSSNPQVFKAPARLVDWYSKNGTDGTRPFTLVYSVSDYNALIASNRFMCEYLLPNTPVKAFFDVDVYLPLCDVSESNGHYFEIRTPSVGERVKKAFSTIPVLIKQTYVLLTRNTRLVHYKGAMMAKVSNRYVFPNVIFPSNVQFGRYLEHLGFKPNEPFDLSVYSKGRIMNAPLCIKPQKEHSSDQPCPPMNIMMMGQSEFYCIENALITAVNSSLPMADMDKLISPLVPLTSKALQQHQSVNTRKTTPHTNFRDMNTEKMSDLLACCNADCGYEAWLQIIAAVRNTIGEDISVYDVCRKWSETSPKFTRKSFDSLWDSLKIQETPHIATIKWHAKIDNPELFEQFKAKHSSIDIYKSRSYAAIKIQFEKRVLKIVCPGYYIVSTNINANVNIADSSSYIVVDDCSLKAMFRDVRYIKQTKKAQNVKEESFVSAWMDDPNKRRFEAAMFDPSRSLPENVFNTFRGFRADEIPSIKESEVAELIRPIREHIRMLIGEEGQVFMEMWLANMVKRPTKKSRIAAVFHSNAEGTGKSMLFNWFGTKVLGPSVYKCIGSPKNQLFGKHANVLQDTLFVQIEEASGRTFQDASLIGEFKDMITRDSTVLERKGIDSVTINNFASFLLTTNNDNPIRVAAKDRRFVYFTCSEEKVGNVAYFESLSKHLVNERVARAFYQYLLNVEIPDVENFEHLRPKTDHYAEMQRANIAPWAKFMSAQAIDNSNNIVKALKFYTDFKSWCEERGYGGSMLISTTAFSLKIKKIDGVEFGRASSGVFYSFDWVKIKAWLCKNNMWDDEAF